MTTDEQWWHISNYWRKNHMKDIKKARKYTNAFFPFILFRHCFFSWFRYSRVSIKHGTEQHFFLYMSNVTQIIFLNPPPPPWNPSHPACIQSCHFKKTRRNNTEASPEGKCNSKKKNATRRKWKNVCWKICDRKCLRK